MNADDVSTIEDAGCDGCEGAFEAAVLVEVEDLADEGFLRGTINMIPH